MACCATTRRQWSKSCRAQCCCRFSSDVIPPFVGGMRSRTIRGAHRACQVISPFSTDSGGNPSKMMTRSSGSTIRLHLRHFTTTAPITLSMTRVERDETRRYLAREPGQRTPFSRHWETEVVGYEQRDRLLRPAVVCLPDLGGSWSRSVGA